MPKQKTHFLAAVPSSVRMTKSFRLDANGNIQKSNYPWVTPFNSFEEKIGTIEELHTAIRAHAEQGHCLIKGQLDRMLHSESRKGHTSSEANTQFMVLDIDGLDIEPDDLMQLLNMGNVDYVLQYSASAGIEAGKDRYHIFFLLGHPVLPCELKLQLKVWNLTTNEIRQHIELSNSKVTLKWPLDITVCQNDKLIYIAPPTCGEGIHDSLDCDRISLHKKNMCQTDLSLNTLSRQTVSAMETALVNELREKQGLPARTFKTKNYKGIEVLSSSDPIEITSVDDCGDFIRLNINNGDSDAYWHPTADPSIIRNFKDEPNLLTKEVAPGYYREAAKAAKEHKTMCKNTFKAEESDAYIEKQQQAFIDAKAAGQKIYFSFRDHDTDQYFVGYHGYATDAHLFKATSSKQKAHEYLIQHHTEKPPIIETWDYQFDPSKDVAIDPQNRFVNQFKPSEYLKNASDNTSATVPENIRRLINHALGNDQESYEHFVNWLAVIMQYRINTRSAWVLQGTTGTGKGLLFHEIISPLIGSQYCRMVTLANMEDQFNKHLEHCIVLFIDEVDTDQIKHTDKLVAKIKNMITEPSLTVRAMRTDIREVKNHVNIIMASNRPNSMRIEDNDRRFNICYRQEDKLFKPKENGEAFIANLKQELQQFADYLVTRTANKLLAARAIDNEPKQQLQEITQTAIEEVASALINGDLRYFVESQIPITNHRYFETSFDNETFVIAHHYRDVLSDAINACKNKKTHVLRHKDLFVLFQGLVGGLPQTKAKLKKRLGHVGIQIKPTSINRLPVRGVSIKWKGSSKELQRWAKALKTSENLLRVAS